MKKIRIEVLIISLIFVILFTACKKEKEFENVDIEKDPIVKSLLENEDLSKFLFTKIYSEPDMEKINIGQDFGFYKLKHIKKTDEFQIAFYLIQKGEYELIDHSETFSLDEKSDRLLFTIKNNEFIVKLMNLEEEKDIFITHFDAFLFQNDKASFSAWEKNGALEVPQTIFFYGFTANEEARVPSPFEKDRVVSEYKDITAILVELVPVNYQD